jgi:hypothetical protein
MSYSRRRARLSEVIAGMEINNLDVLVQTDL